MNVAFYCPLKPPDHPNPSGDRRLARLFIRAIRVANHGVTLASAFRSRDALGDPDRQRRLQRLGARLAARLIRRWRRLPQREWPDIWFTYHAYYKAPDWLGPAVSRALGIPYVIAEASVAPKRAGGPWDCGHRGTIDAVGAADAILLLNPDDGPWVRSQMKDDAELLRFPPFIDVQEFTADSNRERARSNVSRALGIDATRPWLIAVGMMRPGDKLASYNALGRCLTGLLDADWNLLVVGDGVARPAVERVLAPLGGDRVVFLGRLYGSALASTLGACDVLVWPAVNEAFGMSLLEAQALGVPVVAGDTRGVSSVVAHGETGLLVPGDDPEHFAVAVRSMIETPKLRARMGAAARRRARKQHDIGAAAGRLDSLLTRLRDQRR